MTDGSGSLVVHTGLAWHFVPASSSRQMFKNQLVILHLGHDNTMVDPDDPSNDLDTAGGYARATRRLLEAGYSVLVVYMPKKRPGDTPGRHREIVQSIGYTPPRSGSPIRYFMEPIRAALNFMTVSYSSASGAADYTNYFMTGLSGGGWSTTLYAAIDPTIEISFPFAGSVPSYLRCRKGSVPYNDDDEQFYNPLYNIAGYQDLYILASFGGSSNGTPRHQTQVLNRNDSCCFGQAQNSDANGGASAWDSQVRAYEIAVRTKLFQLGQAGLGIGGSSCVCSRVEGAEYGHSVNSDPRPASPLGLAPGSIYLAQSGPAGAAVGVRFFVGHVAWPEVLVLRSARPEAHLTASYAYSSAWKLATCGGFPR